MQAVKKVLLKLDDVSVKCLKGISIFALLMLTLIMTANVINRMVPFANLSWNDEIIELFIAWVVFFGAAALHHDQEHFILDILLLKTKGLLSGRVLRLFINVIELIFFATLMTYGFVLWKRATGVSPTLFLPRKLFYSCIPLSGLFMTCYSVRFTIESLIVLFRGGRYEKMQG